MGQPKAFPKLRCLETRLHKLGRGPTWSGSLKSAWAAIPAWLARLGERLPRTNGVLLVVDFRVTLDERPCEELYGAGNI